MTPFKNIIVLALMLLLSQTAVAMHDVHCLDEQHDQTCEVYFTQDHNASHDVDQSQLERIVYDEKLNRFTTLVSPATLIFRYLSRAPPYHRF